MKELKEMSKTELVLMKCVWMADGPVTATQIMKSAQEVYQLAIDRKTLGTLMYRLEEKEYVKVVGNRGRANCYEAAISEAEMRKDKFREFVYWWFGGSVPSLRSALDEEDFL
ncbi:MAG: BlaI/MecI/CopY family transcriptional regulator [Lachnospiraceae bacterium]|nr:BlaI/MecI/CopY family transcriptional regulator [Lachnospiraceae bacterium]